MNKLIQITKSPKIRIISLLAIFAVWSMFGGIAQKKLYVIGYAVTATVFTQWMIWGRTKLSMFQSAVITGLIIGLLIAPSGNLLFIWTAAVAGITAKRIFRFRGKRHIFNPAAFGLIISEIIFSNHINWWGNSSSIIIIIIGGCILFSLNRLSTAFAYIIVRTVGAVLMGSSFNTALMLPNLFFAFIMLIEPKTSPSKRIEQWLFGGTCGLLSTIFYRFFASFECGLLALLAVNAMRPLFFNFIQFISIKKTGGIHEI
ncbi:hypothetical protein J7L67_03745 [bacterium]|nr:hypothetical protein [bacterium]